TWQGGAVIPLQYELLLSAALFCIGLYGILARRNGIIVLMSIEILLNASILNFVAFSSYSGNPSGQVFALLGIAVAAAEAAVGLGGGFTPEIVTGYVWLPSIPGAEIRFAILIDNLSSLMLVLVSFLCLLIFIYSLAYMHEEEGKARYYAEVSLFATGMLGTVS